VWKAQAHQGFVRGVCFDTLSNNLISVGDDKTVKIWQPTKDQTEPVTVLKGKGFFRLVFLYSI
jgi:hypothetical protein